MQLPFSQISENSEYALTGRGHGVEFVPSSRILRRTLCIRLVLIQSQISKVYLFLLDSAFSVNVDVLVDPDSCRPILPTQNAECMALNGKFKDHILESSMITQIVKSGAGSY